MRPVSLKYRLDFHLPLRRRLALGYLGVLLIFLLYGAITALQFSRMLAANRLLETATNRAMAAEELSRAGLELAIAVDEGILSRDSRLFISQVNAAFERLSQRHDLLRQNFPQTAGLDTAIARIGAYSKPLIAQAETGDWNAIEQNRLTRMGENMARMQTEIDRVVKEAQENRAQAIQTVIASHAAVRINILGLFVLAFLLSSYTVYATVRSITRRVNALTSGAEQVAAGHWNQRVVVETRDEFGQLAIAFNRMAAQLQSFYSNLEARIAERTGDLENLTAQMRTSADVGRAATTILDPSELLTTVTTLISERFNFYHAGIFLLDETGSQAVLRAASGEGGQRMLARRHRLQVGQGVVGTAIASAEPYLAASVGQDNIHYNNPDLPETRSELALPLRARDRIIGALDVQSTTLNAFNPAEIAILQNMADQIALALDNARLYQESQTRLEEVKRLFNRYNRRAWENTLRSQSGVTYRYTPHSDVIIETKEASNEERSQSETEEAQITTGSDVVSTPITIRGQVVGVFKARKRPDAGEWPEEEALMIQAITEQLGVALDSARLYQETQRRAERERLVGQITAKIRASNDPQTILQTAVSELRQALLANQAQVLIQPRDADKTSRPGGNGHNQESE